MIIKNPWKNSDSGKDFVVDVPKFVYGDYAIYKLPSSHLYAYKNMAFAEIVGINKNHLIDVADRSGSGDRYERSIENLQKHEQKNA